jgi:VWFA-related protein
VDVNLVDILATVRDRDGGIVSDLTKDDFILEENGKLQEIRYFSRQTELPLTIGLLIDTSMSQRRLIDRERRASYQFFEQVLRPEQDMAFVIKFDVEVELLQDLTNSRHLLETALNLLQVPGSYPGPTGGGGRSRWQGRPGGQRWPGGQRRTGGQRRPGRRAIGTALYDSVFLAADELLRQQAGRKAIILISDGVDLGSKVSQNDAIEAAQRADTIVYGVRYYDPSAYQRQRGRGGPSRISNSSGKKTLNTISTETGGRMFEVADKLTLEKIFDQIQEELRNQYSIGYTPSDLTGDNLRQVKLRTRDKKLKVQTRAGYYPKPL